MFSGVFGMAIAWGVKRGIYSNEAGQGTAPHAAAAAAVKHPAQQGLVQAFSVYVDTIFVCTATALMILFTGQYNVRNPEITTNPQVNEYIVQHIDGSYDYTAFTQLALSQHFSSFGETFVAISLFFFAFTTIMAYYYYAETNLNFIFGKRNNKVYLRILQIVFLVAVYMGTVHTADLAWAIGDIGVGLMAWVNFIAILLLSKTVFKVWKDYQRQKKEGHEDPIF